ncbi:MAG: nucleoside deaminase [bacterium]
MKWKEIPKPWRVSFKQAFTSYMHGSVPIGAIITDDNGNIIAKGRNRIFEKESPSNQISWNKLAHAEINALLKVSYHEHENIENYTLYTTMEPCPQCFGALSMSSIKNLKYAAEDSRVGSTNLINTNDFIKSRGIIVKGPYKKIEIIQIALMTDFVLLNKKNEYPHAESMLAEWKKNCSKGVKLGKKCFQQKLLNFKQKNINIKEVVNKMFSLL